MIIIVAKAILTLIILFFVVYALLEWRLILLSKKSQRVYLKELDQSPLESLNEKGAQDNSVWPTVTILLPIYNESKVVEALIDAVCAMRYPAEKIQVLVLDDSTDQTTLLAAVKVQHYAKQGVNIAVIKRKKRLNYKAGNLTNGLFYSTGEFLAVFDADFIPPPDFLLKCIPCFEDASIGYLQTGIGYVNQGNSFLTRFQAMMLGHQQFVASGVSYEKLVGALSGSSCVWRRSCVDSLGGWCGSTVAEDADIGYRAQFKRWEYVFLRHVVSLSELSESMDAIRIQRHRWARGLIHNAFKHFSSFLTAGMPLMKRIHAFSLIFSSLLLASIYGLVLLSLPMAIYSHHLGMYFDVIAMLFLLGVVVWIGTNFTGAKATSGEVIGKSFFSKVLGMLMYVSMFFPLSLYYFYAGVELLFTKEYEFKRTPKGGLPGLDEKHTLSKILSSLEWFSFVYSLVALGLGVVYRSYWIILFNMVICLGFGIVIYYSIAEKFKDAFIRR